MEEILEEQAEQLYPLKEKAECHVAFMQGAKFGHDKGVTVGVNAIIDKLITAYNNGKLSVDEMTKTIELLKKWKQNKMKKQVIIRGDRSGVFFGTLEERNGREVKLSNCRRLWYWDGAASLHQLATEGVTAPKNCKFTMRVSEIEILDAIEVIPCTEKAIQSINNVTEWKR